MCVDVHVCVNLVCVCVKCICRLESLHNWAELSSHRNLTHKRFMRDSQIYHRVKSTGVGCELVRLNVCCKQRANTGGRMHW